MIQPSQNVFNGKTLEVFTIKKQTKSSPGGFLRHPTCVGTATWPGPVPALPPGAGAATWQRSKTFSQGRRISPKSFFVHQKKKDTFEVGTLKWWVFFIHPKGCVCRLENCWSRFFLDTGFVKDVETNVTTSLKRMKMVTSSCYPGMN